LKRSARALLRALGVRLNRVFWFKGAIRTVRFTHDALAPANFLKP
jgi:hypothetical protein